MYRLDVSDLALNLPVAFYDKSDSEEQAPFASKQSDRSVAFFALEHPIANTVPIIWDGNILRPGSSTNEAPVLFHAVPADSDTPPATTIPLYEFVHMKSGKRVYTTEREWSQSSYRRSSEPVCRVWEAPGSYARTVQTK